MALNSLPILFYNLGGEMLYVLDQRLKAQSIAAEKSCKVLSDIVGTMFNARFLTEMLKPQVLYSKPAMQTLFNKLVHSSIMKVNDESMDKLYDLMIMAVKYQFTQAHNPRSILHITLNHFDAILKFISLNQKVTNLVLNIFKQLVEVYGDLSTGDFTLLRQSVLYFLQDTNNKVSIYLSQKVQNVDGKFITCISGPVPIGCKKPGEIKIFRNGEEVSSEFETGGQFTVNDNFEIVSNEVHAHRCTHLGTNIYAKCKNSDYVIDGHSPSVAYENHRIAKAELGLLAQLIGTNSQQNTENQFRLTLFDDQETGAVSSSVTSRAHNEKVLNITATRQSQSELSKIVCDMTINASAQSTDVGEDLLALMDM